MRKVHIAQHPPEAHFVKGLLEAQGIAALVRGEALFGVRGEAPLTPETCPSVWVVEDTQFNEARELVLAYTRGEDLSLPRTSSWQCPRCREHLEPQFTECWQCGASRPNGS